MVGVPASTPVAAVKVTPLGKAPDSDNVGAGVPVAVTVNVPATPTWNVALLALVMAGATATGGANAFRLPPPSSTYTTPLATTGLCQWTPPPTVTLQSGAPVVGVYAVNTLLPETLPWK